MVCGELDIALYKAVAIPYDKYTIGAISRYGIGL